MSNISAPQDTERGLSFKLFLSFQAWLLPVAPLTAYLISQVLGLSADEGIRAVLYFLPPLIVVVGAAQPYVVSRVLLRANLAHRPGDAPGDRLGRILKLPVLLLLLGWEGAFVVGVSAFVLLCTLGFGKDLSLFPIGMLVGLSVGALIGVPNLLRAESLLMPHALEELRRHPGAAPKSPGILWVRQSWFLPLLMATLLGATLVLAGTATFVQLGHARDAVVEQLREKPGTDAALLLTSQDVVGAIGLPIAIVALFVLVVSTASAFQLARRQKLAAQSLRETIEELVKGRPRQVGFVASDELGDLALGIDRVLEKLKELPITLSASAAQLLGAGKTLSAATAEQSEALTRQNQALQETQVTTQEIRQTSSLAAQKAEDVLRVSQKADEIGRAGEEALDATADRLEEIRKVVQSFQAHVDKLEQRARQIGGITTTVKDLADQSNMLALNAAIEAVRSGEHGKGFGVVAREIRSLADRSIDATAHIQSALDEIRQAVQQAAVMTDQGAEKVERAVADVRASGDSLKSLSKMVRESSSSARQIAAAVNQQNAGIAQVFVAIQDLSKGMQDTVERVREAKGAAADLESVSRDVQSVAERFSARD